MRSLRSFILHINPELLQAFFHSLLVDHEPLRVRWAQPVERLIQSLQQAVDELPASVHRHVQNEVNRVERLTHAYAQQCLSKLMGRCQRYEVLISSYERSCYAYLHEYPHFQATEGLSMKRTDHDSQRWGHYVACATVGKLSINTQTSQHFRSHLADRLGTSIDNLLFYPTHSTLGQHAEVYLDIYHRDSPEKQLCFSHNAIASVEHDKIMHYKLAYRCNTRLIDVQAPEVAKQNHIAYSFARVFMNVNTVAMRPMTLDPFRYKARLNGDDKNGIARLGLGRMTFEDINTTYSSTHQFSPGADDPNSIDAYFDCSYKGFNPLRSDQFRLTEVLINLDVHSRAGAGRPASMPLSLALPNQTTLRNLALTYQRLGEDYLLHWGIWGRIA